MRMSCVDVIMKKVVEASYLTADSAAGWQLLNKLVESGCTLYYSGDLDPDGIVIADW